MSSDAVKPNRSMHIVLWVLRAVMGMAFLFAAFMKLRGGPAMIAEFATVGLGQWFRYFTATLELIGGLAILVPRISVFGAVLLLIVDFGAFVAQVTILHMGWIHCVVIAVLLGLLIYHQRSALRAVTG